MNNTAPEQILFFLQEILDRTDCFLIQFKVKPTNNFKIYLESDTGFSLEKSIKINRALRKKIDESEMFPEGDYSLEVSSPGIDTPLTSVRHYKKNIGKNIEIEFIDKEKKETKGKLIAVEENNIQILIAAKKKNKKQEATEEQTYTIPYNEIKTAQVCIEFK